MNKKNAILTVGTILTILLCSGCSKEKEQSFSIPEQTIQVVTTTSTTTTTKQVTTTRKTTTTTSKTTTTTSTEKSSASPTTVVYEVYTETIPVKVEEPVEAPTEPITEAPTQETEPVITEPVQKSGVSDYEKVLLANLVANEYGADYVPVNEKAKVVAVVMNRLNVQYDGFTTIEGIVTERGQFTGYYASSSYQSNVTNGVIEAVDYYFQHPEEYSDFNCLYFEGDGVTNYFH